MGALYSIKKVKELPEKAALELTGDDILIIEDEYDTCQLKLSELSTYIKHGLVDKDSFNKLLEEALSGITERLNKAECAYPFKINNISKALPVNLPGKDQEISDKYIENQNNISLDFKKLSAYEYELIVTENNAMNSYYSGGSIKTEHQWYGIIVEFNIDNVFVQYDASQATGNWAKAYSIDESEKTDVYIFNGVDLENAPQEDIERTNNSIIVWLRADDEKQMFYFTDSKQELMYSVSNDCHEIQFVDNFNPIKLSVSVNKYVPEPEESDEDKNTYGTYRWDNKLASEPVIAFKRGMLYVDYSGDIPYTSQLWGDIKTSGNWVGINVTVPEGFNVKDKEYPKVYYDGELIFEGWASQFSKKVADTTRLLLNFTEVNRNILCTIDWGNEYIDNVMVSSQKGVLLYPPLDNV